MINVNKLFANIMAIAFVAGMLAIGLTLYSFGVNGIASWVVGMVFGVYSAAAVASTKVSRTQGIMSK